MDHSLVYALRKDDELLRQYSKILSRIAGAGDEISTIMKQFALHQEKIQKEKHTLHSNIRQIRGILEACDLDSNKLQDALALLAGIEDVVV